MDDLDELARSFAKGIRALNERLDSVEEQLKTIQLIVAAHYLQGKHDHRAADKLYARAIAKARK